MDLSISTGKGLISRWLLVLLLASLLLAGGGLGYFAYRQAITSPGAAPLPATLADLPRVEALTGRAAAVNIARLHQQAFPLSGAAVAGYRMGPHSATLWVSESPLELLASWLEANMEQQIATSDAPFTPQETRQLDGRTVRVLGGLGQRHFYFRSGKRVVWAAVDGALAEAALAELLTFYP